MMKVIIDADGCPVVNLTVKECKIRGIEVVLVADTSHIFDIEGVTCIVADKGADSADYVIAGRAAKGDLVITQDYGLAAMCLTKGARVLRQDGLIYTDGNIDSLLRERYENKKARRAKVRIKGMKKRTAEDDIMFLNSLKLLLD